MSSYKTFASFYDRLTENVDYKVRSEYISNFFSQAEAESNAVLDLACGTGSLCKFLSDMGYSVTGIDISEEMLNEACAKEIKNTVFIKGDITDFKLPYSCGFCICTLDSINHLNSIESVKKCFLCVAQALEKGGIFVFDVNTEYKHKNILGNNTFVFDEDDFFLSWDNELNEDNSVNIFLDFFVFNGKSYDRFSESFTEYVYDSKELEKLLELCGFQVIGVYDELTLNPPESNSERIYYVCKRK